MGYVPVHVNSAGALPASYTRCGDRHSDAFLLSLRSTFEGTSLAAASRAGLNPIAPVFAATGQLN